MVLKGDEGIEVSEVYVSFNRHLPCELQGGHEWLPPVIGEDVLGNRITLEFCKNCGRINNAYSFDSRQANPS